MIRSTLGWVTPFRKLMEDLSEQMALEMKLEVTTATKNENLMKKLLNRDSKSKASQGLPELLGGA